MFYIKIVTFATLKGGAGKTMNLFNLAGVLTDQGKKVLLIDLDPQCNLSANCGVDISDMGFVTMKDIFEKFKASDQPTADKVIIQGPMEACPNIDLIPSSILLFNVEDGITLVEGKSKILKTFLSRNSKYLERYDYIFIDTNPSMSIFNINAFYAADSIIVCSDVSSNSINGAELFCGLWDARRAKINETADEEKTDNIEALLIGNFSRRSNLSQELLEFAKNADFAKDIILDTLIPATVQLKDTEVSHSPINVLHKGSTAHLAYETLYHELVRKGVL